MASFKRIALALLVFALVTLQFAQESSAPTTPSASSGATLSQSDSNNSKDTIDNKKDKKKDKKDKSDNSAPDAYDTIFSDQVANNVLNDIRDGLEAHSQRLMLSAFDADKMDGYLTFEDQIQAYFEHYDGFRV